MAVNANPKKIRRVVSSDGSTWETDAQGAGDYLFNPVFMLFFFLIVVLYATMMQPSEQTALPIPAQMILWGGLIMTSLVWLVISVWASILVYDRGLLGAIYTPLLLLPLIFINATMAQFTLSVFSAGYQESYGSLLENIAQNAIIMIVFDILHARFVVPQHPRHVPPGTTRSRADQAAEPEAATPSLGTPQVVQVSAQPLLIEPGAVSASAPSGQADAPSASTTPTQRPSYIEIAREKIDRASILWIKSEDHYLSLQMTDQNLMLRGKLRAVVEDLGDDLGTQINRSVWIAFSAVGCMEEQATGHLDVSLIDGTVFRVSSSRRLIFKHSYDRFKAA